MIEACVKKISNAEKDRGVRPSIPLEALPKTQNEFNRWDSSGLPNDAVREHGSFHSNGNQTLLKNDDLLQSLLGYFKILETVDATSPAERKKETMASLHRRLAMEKNLRRIAEKELTRARAQVWRGQQEQEDLRASVKSTEAKAAEMIEELEAMIQRVTAERAELARALKKVSGIKPAAK